MRLRSIIVTCFAGPYFLVPGPRGFAAPAGKHKSSVASQESQKAPPVFELHKMSETDLPEPAPVLRMGQSRCDDDGDIYIVYSTTPIPRPRRGRIVIRQPDISKMPVSRISPDPRTVTEFVAQSLSGYRSLDRLTFSVDPSGAVYSLYAGRPSPASEEGAEPWENVVIKFNSDASVASTIVLQNPAAGPLAVERIAAFADGNLLVDAATRDAARRPFTPFTAVYDGNGEIMQELKLPGSGYVLQPALPSGLGPLRGPAGSAKSRAGAAKKSSKQQQQKVTRRSSPGVVRSFLVSGQQDTAYLLRASVPAILYTISSEGQVLHHVRVQFPIYRGKPVNITRAGRSDVAIVYYVSGVDKAGKFYDRNDIAIIDPSTGKIVAIYRPPARPQGLFACATSPTDFLFVASTKSGDLAVVKYSGD